MTVSIFRVLILAWTVATYAGFVVLKAVVVIGFVLRVHIVPELTVGYVILVVQCVCFFSHCKVCLMVVVNVVR